MMTISDMIAVLQAAKEGKKIEARVIGHTGGWHNPGPGDPNWNFSYFEYRAKPGARPEMNILALDLGTATGYAYNRGEEFACGTWKLATPKEIKHWGTDRQRRTKDPRVERLCEHIGALGHFDIIVFEDVIFISSTYQGQLWSSLRAAVWLCADGTLFDCVPVATLKKFATGAGHADKPAMSKFLKLRYPDIWKPELDDNAIDAAWLWLFAKETYKRMKL